MEVTSFKIIKNRIHFFDADGNNVDRKIKYGGFLDLRGTAITALPDNLTVFLVASCPKNQA